MRYRCRVVDWCEWPTLRHTLTHFDLHIAPWYGRVERTPTAAMEAERTLWYKLSDADAPGMAAPVSQLLARLRDLPL
jgi:adenine-specific DNA glycosylase